MPAIPNNFPGGCTGEKIQTAITDMQEYLKSQQYNINTVLQYSPLINLGQSELERRQNEAVVSQSKTVGNISLFIAVTALGISVWGSVGSSRWEEQQITHLKSIDENTEMTTVVSEHGSKLDAISQQLRNNINCVLVGDTPPESKENNAQNSKHGS